MVSQFENNLFLVKNFNEFCSIKLLQIDKELLFILHDFDDKYDIIKSQELLNNIEKQEPFIYHFTDKIYITNRFHLIEIYDLFMKNMKLEELRNELKRSLKVEELVEIRAKWTYLYNYLDSKNYLSRGNKWENLVIKARQKLK